MNKFLFISVMFFSLSTFADWAPRESAPYEILSSTEIVDVDLNGLATSTIEVTKKVLNEQGRNELVLKKISYVPDAQKITILEASSITDGVTTNVDLKTIKDSPAQEPRGGLSNHKEITIPFSNLKIGSTVKYKYREKILQTPVPKHYSTNFVYGINAPEGGGHVLIKSRLPLFYTSADPWGNLTIESRKEGDLFVLEIKQKSSLYKLPVEYNPIFRKNNITSVEVSTLNSWAEYLKPVISGYEKILKSKDLPPAFKMISQKASKGATLEKKIDIVTSELSNMMTYSGDWTSFQKGYFPRPLFILEKLKTGDCKDFSAATVAILRNLGIKADVALTYRKARSSQLGTLIVDVLDLNMPNQRFFNHAVVKVSSGGKTLWVDPTNIVSDASRAFSDIAGSFALAISLDAKGLEKIPYTPMEKNLISVIKTYNIRDDYTADNVSMFEISGDYSKIVIESAFNSSDETAKKILMLFNRTDPKSAQANYIGVDFKSRIGAQLKGKEKSTGEVVIKSDSTGKKFFSAPHSIALQAFRIFNGQQRYTDVNLEGASKDLAILKIPGWDFVGFQSGCTILTPWYSIERKFLKTKEGFEIHDQLHFSTNEISAEDHNSDKFSMFLGDVYDCASSAQVEVVKLSPKDTWESRFKEYTPAKAKEFMDWSGPKFIAGAEQANHVATNILMYDPKNKEALLEKVKSLRWVGYKSEDIDKTEYVNASDKFLQVLTSDYPNDYLVQSQRVWSAYYRKNKAELIAEFTKLHPIAVKDYDFYNLGAKISLFLEKPDAALGSYLKALEKAKTPKQKNVAAVGIGEAFFNKGDIEKGISYYKYAILADPSNTWTQGNLMAQLMSLKKWDQAIEVGEVIMKQNPYGMAKKVLAESYLGKSKEVLQKEISGIEFYDMPQAEKVLAKTEALISKGLTFNTSCTKCLIAMGAIYRIRAMSHGDKDYAFKAKGYYENAIKTGDIQRGHVGMSLIELDMVLMPRKPSSSAFKVKMMPAPELDLER